MRQRARANLIANTQRQEEHTQLLLSSASSLFNLILLIVEKSANHDCFTLRHCNKKNVELDRADAATGCGDLMFSSHMTFAVVCTCTIFKYLNTKIHKIFISTCMIFLIPLTLMSRKHYTVDVWTALYVGPMVYELMYIKWKDCDTRSDLRRRYGITFQGDYKGTCFVTIDRKKMPVSYFQLPKDMRLESKSTAQEEQDDYDPLGSDSSGSDDLCARDGVRV